ncbi:hypothetical protein F5144DRAFT_572914 [Chaetomium tenue]|uniref:Uncharacterized protein n=1 Tax=Chaetomium tenue TaxID=1854479 RepID=A0ACB7P6V1_9PEZI|nr:hypothetical protein F5144DRAFT_572914 [Chaetomium globosum]
MPFYLGCIFSRSSSLFLFFLWFRFRQVIQSHTYTFIPHCPRGGLPWGLSKGTATAQPIYPGLLDSWTGEPKGIAV